jgi:hypothetical protein
MVCFRGFPQLFHVNETSVLKALYEIFLPYALQFIIHYTPYCFRLYILATDNDKLTIHKTNCYSKVRKIPKVKLKLFLHLINQTLQNSLLTVRGWG